MNSIDLKTLRAFVTVAREGNVSRASEKLLLTQPAVSLQLKRLAADAGIDLFRRTAKGMELTAEGTVLLAKAERVFAALADFNQTAHHLATNVRGKLRIGTIIDPEFTRLGSRAESTGGKWPGHRNGTSPWHERTGAGRAETKRTGYRLLSRRPP